MLLRQHLIPGESNLGTEDIAITLTTAAFFMSVVAYISYRKTLGEVDTKDGYFLAGRGLSSVFIAGSLLLTNLSASQLIGLNGSAYGFNLSSMGWEVTAAVSTVAMADLASFKDRGPTSLTDISLRQNISLAYLEQIFIKLKNNNLVKSIRGAKGGYVLEIPPEDIKISNIIKAVDEEVKMLNCKKESKKGCNNKSSKCITHNLWDQLDQHINNFFEKVKLQDLVKKESKFK